VKEPLHALSDAELVTVLQDRYGGIPPAVRDNPELQKLLLPALRADFQMIETYACADEPPLDVPLLVLGGTEDPAVSAAHLNDWRRYTTQDCSVRLLPGGHFFLFTSVAANQASSAAKFDEPSSGLRIILARIEQCLAMNLTNDSQLTQ
jgi:surfactin synthase thioesterase subunit